MSGIDPRRYLLSEEESERIFRLAILPRELAAAKPSERPTVVFVAGQPGAGKTKTTEAVVESLQRHGGAVVVNSDFYKPYHPAYARLLANDDTTAAPYTSLDGRRWMAKAEAYLIEARANVVIETTMRDPGDFQEPARMFRQAGYRAEAAIIAVPAALSRVGILARYEQQVAASGHGRLTEATNHDAAYTGVQQAAEEIDRDRIVDIVTIWSRGNHLVFANQLAADGTWSGPAAAAAALASARARPFDDEQTRQYVSDMRQLLSTTSSAVLAQLEEVQALAQAHLPSSTGERGGRERPASPPPAARQPRRGPSR